MNELTNTNEITNEIEETGYSESGTSTGVAMLIGGLATVAVFATVKGICKACKYIKAKKNAESWSNEEIDDFEGELVEEDE